MYRCLKLVADNPAAWLPVSRWRRTERRTLKLTNMRSKLTSRSPCSPVCHNDLHSQPTPNPRAKKPQMLTNPYLRGASQRGPFHASPCIKLHNVHNENQQQIAASHCRH